MNNADSANPRTGAPAAAEHQANVPTRAAEAILNRLNRPRITGNRHYLFIIRDRLFQAVFYKAGLTYSKILPKPVRVSLELFFLFKAIFAFFSLVYVHVEFTKASDTWLESINWARNGILRLELTNDEVAFNQPGSDPRVSNSCIKVFHPNWKLPLIPISSNLPYKNTTNGTFFSDKKPQHDKQEAQDISKHVIEYSLNFGLLKLNNALRKKYNVPVTSVLMNLGDDECFGSSINRRLIKECLGYDNYLIAMLRSVARNQESYGYFRNLNSGEQYKLNKMWRGNFSYLTALIIMLIFTTIISILLRFIQHQLFVFLVDIIHVVERNASFTYPIALILSAVLALLGMELILYEFFSETSLGFYIIIIIWVADQFDNICCTTTTSKRYWVRFFYMYHFLFYAYHYRFHGQYSSSAYSASWLLIEHSMIWFFHHYEIPAILQEAERRERERALFPPPDLRLPDNVIVPPISAQQENYNNLLRQRMRRHAANLEAQGNSEVQAILGQQLGGTGAQIPSEVSQGQQNQVI